MVRAMVVVRARCHERVLIRAPRRAAAIPSAARGAAELAAIPCPRVARGSMRGWTIVGPFHRGPDHYCHGGRGEGEILDRDADDRAAHVPPSTSTEGGRTAAGSAEEQRE